MELGRHLIVELQGCDPEKLARAEEVEGLLLKAARSSELTVIDTKTHYFSPGATSMMIIGESHLSIHTWPEYGYAALDIFVCGSRDPRRALEVIVKELRPKKVKALEVRRGIDALRVEEVLELQESR